MDSVIIRREVFDCIEAMGMEQRGKVLSAAFCYAFGHTMPELDGAETAVLRFICGQFDRAEANRRKNAANGAGGGRPTKGEPNETEHNPTITQNNPSEPNETEQEPNHNLPRTSYLDPRTSPLVPCALSPEEDTLAPAARESADTERMFNAFWEAYPKKRNKGDAFKAWKQAKVTLALYSRILATVEVAKRSTDWQKEDGRFIPYPATWLRAGAWDDELSTHGGSTIYDPSQDFIAGLDGETVGV